MKVALGADHRGCRLKEALKPLLARLGHRIIDCGTFTTDRTDYPDYAFAVGELVGTGKADRGILICATGIGMSIAANKLPGVRAALCLNEKMARLSREHNNANILCLGADLLTPETAKRLVRVFLKTEFNRGRHARRIRKISLREKKI
ncbi:MAG: ribose 5-phosphate isomerase B [candidate division WOR-3 bacterium]